MTLPSLLPSLFLSHGAPILPLTDAPARTFLAGLGGALERPKAILVASAHWTTGLPAVNAVERNETIHDFYGFPRPLYDLRYPAPGSPALAGRVAGLIKEAGLDCATDDRRGLDHGAWVPLLLMYPKADIPVVAAFGTAAARSRPPSAARPGAGAAAAGRRADHRQRQPDSRSF